jgi:hypothetical protein
MSLLNFSLLGFFFFVFGCTPAIDPNLTTPLSIDNGKEIHFNFEKYSVNQTPDDWSVALTGKGKMCDWKILTDNDNKVLAQVSSETFGYRFNLITNNTISAKDVDITVRFKAIKGNEDQGGGPVWRYQDANNYYVARANPLENNFRLYKVIDGDRKMLKTSSFKMEANQWYKLRIIMKDNKIQCYFNDKLAMTAIDDSFASAGKIGLWSKSDAYTYFDDLNLIVK